MVKIAFFKDELEIPDGVKVTLEGGHHIRVKGPNGDITKDFSHVRGIKVKIENKKIIFYLTQNDLICLEDKNKK